MSPASRQRAPIAASRARRGARPTPPDPLAPDNSRAKLETDQYRNSFGYKSGYAPGLFDPKRGFHRRMEGADVGELAALGRGELPGLAGRDRAGVEPGVLRRRGMGEWILVLPG